MFSRRKAAATDKERIAELERVVDVQGFILAIVGIVAGVAVGVAAILFEQEGKVDYDHIAVSMTIFQTLFGIAALYGFWALRGLTREKAEEVAREIANEVAVREMAKVMPVARRMAASAVQTFSKEDPISTGDLDSLVDAFGGEEGDDGQ